METNPPKPALELTLTCGKNLTVEVVGYHLKLNDKLHIGAGGGIYKLGTFKVNSASYKGWGSIEKIKFITGECRVLSETPPRMTPRTITYRVRFDFNN